MHGRIPMQVFGDREWRVPLGDVARRLAASAGGARTIADLRRVLIQAGELEQAAADAALSGPSMRQVSAATDAAAAAFVCALDAGAQLPRHLARLRRAAAAVERLRSRGTLRLPEGYAFYLLYPEQYVAAARAWARGRPRGRVEVVGLRSIGTSLGAVVAAALAARGWRTRRISCRPSGHPFARRIRLPEGSRAAWALVVDEGPGLSGSSMAAAGRALVARRHAASRIAFLCAHGGGPGPAASPEVAACWRTTPVWHASATGVMDAAAVARRAVEAALGQPVDAVEEWRGDPSPLFALPKVVVTASDGKRYLCKFYGIAVLPDGRETSRVAGELLSQRAARGWCGAPIAVADGFVVSPWLDGVSLGPSELRRQAVLAHALRYLRDVMARPLRGSAARVAAARLLEVAHDGVGELCGGADAAKLGALSAKRLASAIGELPRSGDGQVPARDWIRGNGAALWKVGGVAHDLDHTWPGEQPVLWDLAGLVVEAAIVDPTPLLAAFHRVTGMAVTSPLLAVYRVGYALAQIGRLRLGGGDPIAAALRVDELTSSIAGALGALSRRARAPSRRPRRRG